jgi:hypothetical protein
MDQNVRTTIGIIFVAMLAGGACVGQTKNALDLSKTAVILPFESEVKKASGLPDATRTAIIQFLKDESMFAAVLTPDEAKEKDKTTLIEFSAKLIDFASGNMATRIVVGLGAGRAHAGFDFTAKDAATGNVLWEKTIKEKASFWSNSASSVAQRMELPEKIAKTFVKEINKAKAR